MSSNRVTSSRQPRPGLCAGLVALCLVGGTLPSLPCLAEPPTSTEAALDLASQLHEAHRYADAARAFDAVTPPDPRHRLAAAECWALAGELGEAEVRLVDVLAEPALSDDARARADRLLTRVRAATPHAARARASIPVEAAPAWEAAFAASDLGVFLVAAGLSWESARRPGPAVAALTSALRRDDLPADELRSIPVRLAALQSMMPPPPPDRTAAWVVTGLGTASLLFGAGSFIVAEGHRDDMLEALDAPLVTSLSRAEAQHKQAQADAWNVAGWIGLGAGLALTTTGLALFSIGPDEPHTGASLRVEATWKKDGPLLVTHGSF